MNQIKCDVQQHSSGEERFEASHRNFDNAVPCEISQGRVVDSTKYRECDAVRTFN